MSSNNTIQRWICQVHVLPSTHDEYYSPGALGAYVCVVADADSRIEFEGIVRSTLENTMQFPVLEIYDTDILLPDRILSEELKDSIDQILPVFPIAFSSFYFYTEEQA